MDDDQRRKRCPVDRVEQEHPARLQDALNFIEHPVQIGDVLQDVHTDDAVDAMVGKGDAFAAAGLVIDFKRLLGGMVFPLHQIKQFARLELVTQEEFELQRQVLARTREKLEALEARVAQLEAKRSQTSP